MFYLAMQSFSAQHEEETKQWELKKAESEVGSPIFFLQALTFPSLLLAVMALALVALGPGGLVLTPPRPASPTGTHHTSPKQPHSRHLHPHTHPARPWQEITHMLGPASYLV